MSKYKAFVYEWVNLINGKKYIGGHIGDENDSYIGSGVAFRADLKKYGLVNFERKILEYLKDSNELRKVETAWLTKVDAMNNEEYYNRSNSSSNTKRTQIEHTVRPLCDTCQVNHCAINYTNPDGLVRYRSKCSQCIRQSKKQKKHVPAWAKAGYTKKTKCDKCNFQFKLLTQSNVFYLDGNLKNNDWLNLRTVCLNCQEEILKSKTTWKPSPLTPDF